MMEVFQLSTSVLGALAVVYFLSHPCAPRGWQEDFYEAVSGELRQYVSSNDVGGPSEAEKGALCGRASKGVRTL